MKTDQLMHDRESWQTVNRQPASNGGTLPATEGAAGPAAAHRAAWQEMIDQKLLEWSRDPSQLEDDRLDPPSVELSQRVIDFARALQHAGYLPPTNVVPDGSGGIVFHRRQQDHSEEIHFWDDGDVDYCQFHGARLVERRPL
jgi:hypothetical protein